MKKLIIVWVLLMIEFTSLNAETWREFRNRVETMSDRVIVPKYFDSDTWLDNLAAVIATHDWCRKMYKYILENDNTMSEGERSGRALSQLLHEMKFKEYWDYARKLSQSNWNYVYRRYGYWFDHLQNEGWITFQDMR
jgi:CRISPR/Cas system CSM-associated protein Csm2 small subunit